MSMHRQICATVIAVAMAGCCLLQAGEFAVDEHTLLLAHFNAGLDADFAKGSPKATGHASLDPAGKYGAALAARRGPVMADNYPVAYCALGFEVTNNLNPQTGTLEMWVKTSFNPQKNPKNDGGFAFYRLIQVKKAGLCDAPAERYKLLLQISEFNHQPETRALQLFTGSAKYISGSVSDQHEQWVHYAVTWDNGNVNCFLNGTRINTVLKNPNGMLYLNADPAKDKFYIGGPVSDDFEASDTGSAANSLIDELRISDVVRYKSDFSISNEGDPRHTAGQFNPANKEAPKP